MFTETTSLITGRRPQFFRRRSLLWGLTCSSNECKLTMLTIYMNTTLGERIRELREKMDLSLRELASKLRLSAAFLSDIELGRRYPSEKVLAQIAKELGTSLDDLQQHDTRAPVEGLKRLASANPA